MTIKKKSRKLEEGLKKAASSIGKTLTRSQVKLEKTGRKAVKKAEILEEGLKKAATSLGKTLTSSQVKLEKSGRKAVKKGKKAATSLGKTLSSSQVKLEKSGRKAVKKAEKLVGDITHSAGEVLAKTASKLKQAEERISGDLERGSSRFKGVGRKSVAEAIGTLAEEIRLYIEEHEEIGASKLLSVMKSQGHSDAMVFAGMGWLVRDKKIVISSDGKKVSLA